MRETIGFSPKSGPQMLPDLYEHHVGKYVYIKFDRGESSGLMVENNKGTIKLSPFLSRSFVGETPKRCISNLVEEISENSIVSITDIPKEEFEAYAKYDESKQVT